MLTISRWPAKRSVIVDGRLSSSSWLSRNRDGAGVAFSLVVTGRLRRTRQSPGRYGQDGRVPANVYPRWDYFPRNVHPPEWVEPLVAEVRAIELRISTVDQGTGLHSNDVLQELAPGLRQLGYTVESSRSAANRIRRPVLFGSNGRAEVAYDIDAFHDGHGIVVEVEAGRAASNNATYRNIIRASLILDAQFLVLLLPVTYRFNNRGQLASVPVFTRGL